MPDGSKISLELVVARIVAFVGLCVAIIYFQDLPSYYAYPIGIGVYLAIMGVYHAIRQRWPFIRRIFGLPWAVQVLRPLWAVTVRVFGPLWAVLERLFGPPPK